MFLINRIKLETVKDKALLQVLKKWFNIAPNEYNSNSTLLDPYSKKLNNLEIEKISTLDLDFNFYQNPVQMSKRLRVDHVTYHSQDYSRVCNKRCNYAVKYRADNDLFEFGMIKYFLKINGRVLIALTQFKIVGNIINKIGGRTSNALIGIKNSGVFNQFYSDIKEIKDSLIIIDATKLISKCIFSTTTISKKYLISKFIIENEHE
jgi:hypothetical protein